jgi:TPR repeat protein
LEVRQCADEDTALEQRALAAAIDQAEDAAAQETPSPGAGVEANVQLTPDEVLEARSALERGDYTTAFGLFHPLEDQGRSFTETMLGGAYLDAAEKGNAVAQSILGFIYAIGSSPPNYDEATRWWHRAANQGEPHAQYYLGQAYGAGRGVPLDHVQAFKYLTLASQKSSDVAGNRVEQLWALRLKMSDLELAQAARLMRKWQPTSEV